jgi:hypothetical protein
LMGRAMHISFDVDVCRTVKLRWLGNEGGIEG